MRLKRSVLPPCPVCKERKYLEVKTDYGGARYVDMFAIVCQWCDTRTKLFHSVREAMDGWTEKYGVQKTDKETDA